MRLYDEIFKNADGGALSRCIVVPCGGGYFEGVKSVGDFSTERIVICFPKQTVEAEGKGLSILKYCDGDLQIAGKILSLRVLTDGREG
ncbi:MAG: YabP/YqfC family sporulation protein [Clostridia bacterium]|nr:YabP/YqfC family sporulation protein [Clostridia bacterium]